MAQESIIPQSLMTGALLHFESGVPIADVDVRRENKDRLARVDHVYWQWKKNPFLDTYELFRQLVRQAMPQSTPTNVNHAAQKDKLLFDFVVEHVAPPSRRQDEAKVRWAAERMLQIGAETDNIMALDKGSKRLYEVAGLDKPESEQADMSKANFLQPVVTLKASEVDETKIDYDDEQSLLIMKEFGAYIDPKRTLVDDKVSQMEVKNDEQTGNDEHE